MFKFLKNKKRFLSASWRIGMTKSIKRHNAFTLVELIVVIALIAILALIIFIIIDPTKMKQKANDGKVRNDVSQIAGALAQYMADYNKIIVAGGCNFLNNGTMPSTYFKDNMYPVHPCNLSYQYKIDFTGTSNFFIVTGQLCSDTTKFYNSKGIIVNGICEQF